ncbi:MAG: SDR family NAD(P)-dependent oxidoreductase [Myxococcales bacterium]|nr:SDR family NAD(P)-dependent oxidoreductase [Myxococcales bacterium]
MHEGGAKVGVVTGASGGIGKEIAKGLARAGWTVVLVGRDRARTEAAASEAERVGGSTRVVIADLARQSDVRRAASEIRAAFDRVDALINNAASIPHERRVTEDGHEEAFATNVLAPHLLTELLAPALEGGGRVIGFYGGGRPNFRIDDLESDRRDYDGWLAYTQSKNAVAMLTREGARRRRERDVTVTAAIPGLVNTEGMRALPGTMRFVSTLFRPFMRTPAEGARTPLWLATEADADAIRGRIFGSMFGDWKREYTQLPAPVVDDQLAAQLYERCDELTSRASSG